MERCRQARREKGTDLLDYRLRKRLTHDGHLGFESGLCGPLLLLVTPLNVETRAYTKAKRVVFFETTGRFRGLSKGRGRAGVKCQSKKGLMDILGKFEGMGGGIEDDRRSEEEIACGR